MKHWLLGLSLAGVLVSPTWAEGTGNPAVVHVKKAPFHLFTFEDENMSLENVVLPAGKSTSYHSHDQDLVFVITTGARITNQVLGKDPVELEFKQGEVRFAGYTKTPGVHQITNIEKDKMMQLLAVAIVYPEPGRHAPGGPALVPVPRGRGDRLSRGPRSLAVRHPQSECDHDLRLRVVVLNLKK